jgi:hypothetical protein
MPKLSDLPPGVSVFDEHINPSDTINDIHGPYQITDQDIDEDDSIDAIDLGTWYIAINGETITVDNQREGIKFVQILKALNFN